MGGTACRCQCEDSKAEPNARVLPPPGEDFNALSITIESASFQAAKWKRDQEELQLHCTCEVPSKPHKKCRTQSVGGSLAPAWRYEGELVGVERGDDLVFKVFDKDDLVATARLPSSDLLDRGFQGCLQLRLESVPGEEGTLYVSAQPEYVPPDQAGVVQILNIPGEPGAKVRVTFQIPDSKPDEEVSLDFTQAPLGMTFAADIMPMAVRYEPSAGQAKDMGVQQGWVITKIDGTDITQMQYEAAFDLFKERVKVLPKT
mmetsp:Transcript_90406/g.264541  ORF Transcript_90406/g.264541 Transcript_90406/m.264541 type:complete len:259 (+) Transcript_90406:62-838(+)